jgi:hypothetical protein
MDPSLRELQKQLLEGIVAGVSQAPGIVQGYWAEGISDPPRSHTFIVFADRASAEAFCGRRPREPGEPGTSGGAQLSLELAEVTTTT